MTRIVPYSSGGKPKFDTGMTAMYMFHSFAMILHRHSQLSVAPKLDRALRRLKNAHLLHLPSHLLNILFKFSGQTISHMKPCSNHVLTSANTSLVPRPVSCKRYPPRPTDRQQYLLLSASTQYAQRRSSLVILQRAAWSLRFPTYLLPFLCRIRHSSTDQLRCRA